jgi:predicted alpha/beta superfamily hydrolase
MSPPSTRKQKTQPAADVAIPISTGKLWLHELTSRVFGNTRLLRVWLPPDYDGWGANRYPVLYLNDGQNLFDPATAFAGVHWQVAETATRLITEQKIRPLVIVGIDNTKERACEYIPYRSKDPRVLRAKGKRYPEFLQCEVMPLIEGRYSILRGPENSGLGGSSLGGLITLYTQLAAPGVFGRALIESPSLFVANRKILEASRKFRDWPTRTYLGMGTRETGNATKDAKIVEDVRELETIMRANGLDEQRLRVRIIEGATHSETAWAERFPEALEFLFKE